jgi:hypothetical protein
MVACLMTTCEVVLTAISPTLLVPHVPGDSYQDEMVGGLVDPTSTQMSLSRLLSTRSESQDIGCGSTNARLKVSHSCL